MTWFEKLKAEWKTFALAVATTIIGLWDTVVTYAQQYGYDYTTIVKQEYRMYVIPAVGVAMLLLRKWKAAASTKVTQTVTEVTTEAELPVPTIPEVSTPEVK